MGEDPTPPRRGWGLGRTCGVFHPLSGRPQPLSGTPQPHFPPLQWQLAALPAPQPPQGVAGGGGAPMGLSVLGLSDATLQAFAEDLQGVVTVGIVSALPSPSPAFPGGKVARLSLLHLRFACGVAGDSDVPPIWEAVALGQGKTEGLENLNQALMRGLPSCRKVFGGGRTSAPPSH